MADLAAPVKAAFAMVCKTYSEDLVSFRRMLVSFEQHNVEGITLFVSVPATELSLFETETSKYKAVTLVTDESYADQYFVQDTPTGLPVGYINQEICKLAFWESGRAENVLFVDSDVYFIRDFKQSDFMATDTVPYSVLTMDKDLHTEVFYRAYGEERHAKIKTIFEAVGLDDRRLLTCHGMTVLNATVQADFKTNFMSPKGYDYATILALSPFEYSWYNAWLQKSQVIPVMAVEPFFKTYHMRIEYIFSRLRLISEQDLAQQYVGVILNSNWRPKGPPSRYEPLGRLQRLAYKLADRLG